MIRVVASLLVVAGLVVAGLLVGVGLRSTIPARTAFHPAPTDQAAAAAVADISTAQFPGHASPSPLPSGEDINACDAECPGTDVASSMELRMTRC
jgi:hypothetical protein